MALILFIAGGFILLVLAIAILARWRSTARAMSRPPDRRQSQRKRAGG